MDFLKARWEHLIMVNYTINPEVLKPFLPIGTELDLHEGNCYVSIVGFMFKNTKVKRIGLPFHQDFEEVNIRFYVKRKEDDEVKRGVVFIKEIVPKKLISLVANTLYNEHYFTTKMNHSIKKDNNALNIHYGWENKGKKQFVEVTSEVNNNPIMTDSVEEFIAEHYWGYTKINEKKTSSYEVKHPSWNQHKIINYNINVDFKENYGEYFEVLNNSKPHSVFLLDGSEISVGNKQVIE